MTHTILIVAFLIFETLAIFEAWIPTPRINLVAAGLACYAASLLF